MIWEKHSWKTTETTTGRLFSSSFVMIISPFVHLLFQALCYRDSWLHSWVILLHLDLDPYLLWYPFWPKNRLELELFFLLEIYLLLLYHCYLIIQTLSETTTVNSNYINHRITISLISVTLEGKTVILETAKKSLKPKTNRRSTAKTTTLIKETNAETDLSGNIFHFLNPFLCLSLLFWLLKPLPFSFVITIIRDTTQEEWIFCLENKRVNLSFPVVTNKTTRL